MASTTTGEPRELPPQPDNEDRPRITPAWRIVLTGAALGLGWGILARGWMRYISTDPEFTWSGTMSILAVAALAGTSLGAVEALRRRRRGWWRCLLAIPALLLFASPGMLMAPAAVLGGAAFSGRGPRWTRLILAALAAAPVLLFVAIIDEEAGPSRVGSVGGFVLLCLALAAGWSAPFRARAVENTSQYQETRR